MRPVSKCQHERKIKENVLTQNEFGGIGDLGGELRTQPHGKDLGRDGGQTVARQVQIGDVLDVRGGFGRDAGDFVVVQVQEPQVGDVGQGLPGEGGEGVAVQPELVQVGEAPEALHVQGAERVERHPEELQAAEVVEVVGRNPRDGGLFDAQL